jgi:hypothetical protein
MALGKNNSPSKYATVPLKKVFNFSIFLVSVHPEMEGCGSDQAQASQNATLRIYKW